MSFYDNLYEKKKRELLQYALFKKKFLTLWEEHGDFLSENEKRYMDSFRISGDSVGAIEMSKVLGSPTLHNDIEDGHISHTDIVLDFSKLISLSPSIFSSFVSKYISDMKQKEFGKLFYRCNSYEVVEAYFSTVETTTTVEVDAGEEHEVESESITRVEDEFLDTLALDIAEMKRVDYYHVGLVHPLAEIILDEYVSKDDISSKIENLKHGYYWGSVDEYETPEMKIPAIEDRIRAFAVEEGVGFDIYEELGLEKLTILKKSYWDIEKAKALAPQKFFKLIQKVLDFDSQTKEKYWWRKILVATAVFVVAVAYIYVTADVYSGFALITGYFGSAMDSEELKIIASILSFGSAGMGADGVFSLSNVGYGEAISLIMNVGSLAYSMSLPKPIPRSSDDFNQEEGSSLMYDAPYAVYDAIYDYEALTSVDVNFNGYS